MTCNIDDLIIHKYIEIPQFGGDCELTEFVLLTTQTSATSFKMRFLLLLGFVAVAYISTCQGNDLIVGTSYNTRLIWQQKLEYMAIPFKKRVKEMFYSDPGNQIIKVNKNLALF